MSFLDGLADKSIFLFNGRNAGENKGHIGAEQMREIYMQKSWKRRTLYEGDHQCYKMGSYFRF